ncbi:MAG: SGNH/GDSL hydrolase family protein [Lachnospiraceae bacterium]|nr:SGNH/GDSL hydrolase family protein [Lachnospiraceae bacterium]
MTREPLYTSNSKKLKIIIFSAALLIFSFGAAFYAGRLYKEASEKNTVNMFTKTRFSDFYAEEKNTIDMVFIGSSHAYCAFDPANFDEALGISSFQMGTPLQTPDTTYFSLLDIFETQSPSVVVMEVYFNVLNEKFNMKQADSFFEGLDNDKLKEEYIKEVFPLNEKIKYNLPFIRYQQDFFAYQSSLIEDFASEKFGVSKKKGETQEGVEEYRAKGYVYCDMNMLADEFDKTNQFKGINGNDFKFDKSQKGYMEKIIGLCAEKNARLIFVTAPIANVSMGYIENYDAIYSKISEFAAENQIPYIDYNIINQNEALLKNENFRDDAHLNDSGVKIVDAHFLSWLKQSGIF